MVRWKVPRVLDSRGRPQTVPRQTWDKTVVACGHPDVPDGTIIDATPAPYRTYTRATWPPRGRGRGESLYSERRINAKIRAVECFKLRIQGNTWQYIGSVTGLSTSGAYRAVQRAKDRVAWDQARKAQLKQS
jgi:hypothetical protein